MLKFTQCVTLADANAVHSTLTLPFEKRVISRQRVTLDDGCEAGLFLPRGTILQQGDYLLAESGEIIAIQAACEEVSTLYCSDALHLARACYHLGNRHVPLQIGQGMLRYQHDHVLDAMLAGLGLKVEIEKVPFVPEAGAYHGEHSHQHHEHKHA